MLCVSELQSICKGGIDFAVSRDETHMIDKMDLHPKKCNIFGTRFLVSDDVVRRKQEALELSKEEQAKAGTFVQIELSEREKRIVQRLNNKEL
jgi:Zn-dependent peptidase ImmA (M78 family)